MCSVYLLPYILYENSISQPEMSLTISTQRISQLIYVFNSVFRLCVVYKWRYFI